MSTKTHQGGEHHETAARRDKLAPVENVPVPEQRVRSQARRGRAFGHPLQRRLLRWFYQSVEDAFTDAGMVSKSASTAARVVLSTREGDLIHVAVRRRWREPVHQYIAGHIERDLGRKTIEYLVYLRRQRKFLIFNHGVR